MNYSLNDIQKRAIEVSKKNQQDVDVANKILLENLNAMYQKNESVVLKDEDIYPELWEVLNKAAIDTISSHMNILNDAIKDLIRKAKFEEAISPIVNAEDREKKEEGTEGILAYSSIFKMRNGIVEKKEDILDAVIKELKIMNECGMYSDFNKDLEKWIKENKILAAAIDKESITRDDYNQFMEDFNEAGGNRFIGVDIIFNIFEQPYDVKVCLADIKYGYIKDMMYQEQQPTEIFEKIEDVDEEEYDADDEVDSEEE